MSDFRERIKSERKRRGLNQEGFAKLAGVSKNAQSHYEAGLRTPNADYFVALQDSGVDVAYLLTGSPSSSGMTPDEQQLLALYRQLDDRERKTVLASVAGISQSPLVSVSGSAGAVNVVHGDVHAPIDMSSNKKSTKPQS